MYMLSQKNEAAFFFALKFAKIKSWMLYTKPN